MSATIAQWGYHNTLVVYRCCRLLHRCHRWVGLLVAYLLWRLSWCLLFSWKLILRVGTFRWVPVQKSLDPVSEAHGIFSKNLSSTSAGPPKTKMGGCLLWESLVEQPWPITQEGFWCLLLKFLLGFLRLLKEVPQVQIERFIKQCMCIHIQDYAYFW